MINLDKSHLNVKHYCHSYPTSNLCSRVAYKSALIAFKENKMSVLHRDQKLFSIANEKKSEKNSSCCCMYKHALTNIGSHTWVKKAMNDLKLRHRT